MSSGYCRDIYLWHNLPWYGKTFLISLMTFWAFLPAIMAFMLYTSYDDVNAWLLLWIEPLSISSDIIAYYFLAHVIMI